MWWDVMMSDAVRSDVVRHGVPVQVCGRARVREMEEFVHDIRSKSSSRVVGVFGFTAPSHALTECARACACSLFPSVLERAYWRLERGRMRHAPARVYCAYAFPVWAPHSAYANPCAARVRLHTHTHFPYGLRIPRMQTRVRRMRP